MHRIEQISRDLEDVPRSWVVQTAGGSNIGMHRRTLNQMPNVFLRANCDRSGNKVKKSSPLFTICQLWEQRHHRPGQARPFNGNQTTMPWLTVSRATELTRNVDIEDTRRTTGKVFSGIRHGTMISQLGRRCLDEPTQRTGSEVHKRNCREVHEQNSRRRDTFQSDGRIHQTLTVGLRVSSCNQSPGNQASFRHFLTKPSTGRTTRKSTAYEWPEECEHWVWGS